MVPDSALRRATWLAVRLLVFTIPFQGVVKVAGVGTITRAVGLGAIALALAAVAVEGRRQRLVDAHVIMLLFLVWVAASSYWTIDTELTGERIVTMVQLAAMVLLVWEFSRTPARQLALLRCYVLGAAVTCASVLWSYLQDGRAEVDRYTSAEGVHPNDVAFVLCLAIPLAWYLAARAANRREALLYRLFAPAAVLAIVLTASRAGVIVLVVALLIIPLSMRDSGPAWRAGTALGLVACLVFGPALLPEEQVERLSTIPAEVQGGTLNERTLIWEAAFEAFGDHPVLGVGAGASRVAISRYSERSAGAHNTFLSVAAELGAVGLGLFCLMLLAVGLRTLRLRGLEAKLAAVVCATVLAGLQPRHWEYHKSLWIMLALLLGLDLLSPPRPEVAALPRVPDPSPRHNAPRALAG